MRLQTMRLQTPKPLARQRRMIRALMENVILHPGAKRVKPRPSCMANGAILNLVTQKPKA
jgi:hypothetical protein